MPQYYLDTWSELSRNEYQLGAGEHSQHGGVGAARQSESVVYLSLHTHKLIHAWGGVCVCLRIFTYMYILIYIYIHKSLSQLAKSN